MENKLTYEEPIVEIIEFLEEDIIVTSGYFRAVGHDVPEFTPEGN